MSKLSAISKLWRGRIVVVVVVLLVIGLSTGSTQAVMLTTFSSPIPGNPSDLTPRAWLPLIMSQQFIKARSGIHLGNRTSDWPTAFFQRIKYQTDGSGVWPAAVMVLSNQVYNIPRDPNDCRVKWWEAAGIANPNVFAYLTQAAQAGTKVIIRLYPSPGNFADYNVANWPNHDLITTGPAGSRYLCNNELGALNAIGKPAAYRSPGDLVDEMASIHRANAAYGWTEFGFEPANEPNLEWYYPPSFTWGPSLNQTTVWEDMDDYFAAVYDYYTRNSSTLGVVLRIFTPSMDQEWYSIQYDLSVCEERKLVDGQIGYAHMQDTYNSTRFDGYDWHNYWMQGHEQYTTCQQGGNIVSYYFPVWMTLGIIAKGGNITEADLASPNQMRGLNPLHSKQGTDANAAAASLKQFVAAEPTLSRVISWLLNDNTGNSEHDWHEAYDDSGYGWAWFQLWWMYPANAP